VFFPVHFFSSTIAIAKRLLQERCNRRRSQDTDLPYATLQGPRIARPCQATHPPLERYAQCIDAMHCAARCRIPACSRCRAVFDLRIDLRSAFKGFRLPLSGT